MGEVILAIDIGSSSVRCTAYRLTEVGGAGVEALKHCSTSRTMRSVQPTTGKIQLFHKNQRQSETPVLAIPETTSNEAVESSLMEEVDACIDETLLAVRKYYGCDNNEYNQPPKLFRVVGVGISSFVMNLVGVDAKGNLIGEDLSISYACNSPSVAKECQRLRSELGKEKIDWLYQQTGAPIHSAYALAQLRTIYGEDCKKSSVFKWQSIASVCLCRWIGRTNLPISFSEASWTGLLDFRNCSYEASALDLLPEKCRKALPSLADFSEIVASGLPEFVESDDVDCGSTTDRNTNKSGSKMKKNPFWDRWPELRRYNNDNSASCSFFLGLGDGACANVGSKCSTTERIAVTIGTSAAARMCLRFDSQSSLRVPPGLFCYRVDRHHILVGGALTDGGSVVEWASQLLNLNTDAEAFSECLKKVKELVDGETNRSKNKTITDGKTNDPVLTVLPFLGGERSTGYRDGATGAICGLTRDTTPAHFLKSCLEGVTLRIRAILELILETGRIEEDSSSGKGGESGVQDPTSCNPVIIASGKALERNDLWRQMISDSIGLQVILDHETNEGTSRGVARLVAVALAASSNQAIDASGMVDTTQYLREEPLGSFSTSDSRDTAKLYFDRLVEAQESFLNAVSPLYES